MKQICEEQMHRINGQSQWLSSIETIEFNQLDLTSIELASRLTREIRKRSGMVISLHDQNMVRELGKGVIATDAGDLNLMYRALLDNIKNTVPQMANATNARELKPQKSLILSFLGLKKVIH